MSFSGLDVDIVILLELLEKLSGKDTLKLCSSNKKLFNLCKKYQDVIWKKKLRRDFDVEENEIIGSPMSHYLGLERNEGWYYYYALQAISIFEDTKKLRHVKKIDLAFRGKGTKEDEPSDDSFFVPGIDVPKGEKILFARFYLYSEEFGGQEVTAAGKNAKKVLRSLMSKIENEFWDNMSDTNADLYKRILNLFPGEEIETDAIINVGYGGDIPVSFEIQAFLYTVKLPQTDVPFEEQ